MISGETPRDRITVHDLLLEQQNALEVKLTGRRRVIGHPTAKGDATEFEWCETIGAFLPKRYKVAKAFVIDGNSNTSDQIDVVIYDRQYCPLFFEAQGARFIPAESVYAVFEVKQEIDSGEIAHAGRKAASVRRLHRTNMPVHTANGMVREPNPLFNILAGVLTLDSSWSPPLGDAFEHAIAAAEGEEALDLGCSLKHGGFVIERRVEDEMRIRRSEPAGSLMFFLQHLYSRLQTMATVPVMDLALYARELQED
jgi:uncharacterized protein DUF6602